MFIFQEGTYKPGPGKSPKDETAPNVTTRKREGVAAGVAGENAFYKKNDFEVVTVDTKTFNKRLLDLKEDISKTGWADRFLAQTSAARAPLATLVNGWLTAAGELVAETKNAIDDMTDLFAAYVISLMEKTAVSTSELPKSELKKFDIDTPAKTYINELSAIVKEYTKSVGNGQSTIDLEEVKDKYYTLSTDGLNERLAQAFVGVAFLEIIYGRYYGDGVPIVKSIILPSGATSTDVNTAKK